MADSDTPRVVAMRALAPYTLKWRSLSLSSLRPDTSTAVMVAVVESATNRTLSGPKLRVLMAVNGPLGVGLVLASPSVVSSVVSSDDESVQALAPRMVRVRAAVATAVVQTDLEERRLDCAIVRNDMVFPWFMQLSWGWQHGLCGQLERLESRLQAPDAVTLRLISNRKKRYFLLKMAGKIVHL
ncbi:MAG: hypothetical protein AAGC55_27455 [Myxococcota bacterium]